MYKAAGLDGLGLDEGSFTSWASLVVQWQRIHLPMQETPVRSLGWKDTMEKETATHFSILAREITWTEKPGKLQSMGSQKSQTQQRYRLVYPILKETKQTNKQGNLTII